MKKILLLLLPIVAFALNSCNDDDDDLLNPDLIKGSWELIADRHAGYSTVYIFETVKNFNNYGILEVKHLHANGPIVEEISVSKYDWHASGPQNNNGILDITLTPYGLETDDPGYFYEFYEITNLTQADMLWRGIPGTLNAAAGKSLEFVRMSEK